MTKIEQAVYDSIVKEKGRKAANEWAAMNVTLYDLYEARRTETPNGDDVPPEAKWLFRATLKVIERFLDLHKDGTRRVMHDLREKKTSFVYHNHGRMVGLFHGIRVAEGGTTPSRGEYEVTTDNKRLNAATYVMIKVPPMEEGAGRLSDEYPYLIALDVGPRVWVHASYLDNLPEGVVQVGDCLSPGYSQDGSRIISVPSEWCTFLTEEEVDSIGRMRDADEQLLAQATG